MSWTPDPETLLRDLRNTRPAQVLEQMAVECANTARVFELGQVLVFEEYIRGRPAF